MAKLFQPTTSPTVTDATPSPAAQALAAYKMQVLGQMLDAASKPRPSFKDFVGGAQLPAEVPGGLSAGIPALLQAFAQPGSFTSEVKKKGGVETPSIMSDLGQLGILGALLYQSGAFGAGAKGLDWILSGVGGAKGIGGVNPALGDTVANTYGSSSDLIPGGSAGNVPIDYPGLVGGSTDVSNILTNNDLTNILLGL